MPLSNPLTLSYMDQEMQRQYLIDVMGLSPEEIDNLPEVDLSKLPVKVPYRGANS